MKKKMKSNQVWCEANHCVLVTYLDLLYPQALLSCLLILAYVEKPHLLMLPSAETGCSPRREGGRRDEREEILKKNVKVTEIRKNKTNRLDTGLSSSSTEGMRTNRKIP